MTDQLASFYVYQRTGNYSPSGAEDMRIWSPLLERWRYRPLSHYEFASAQKAYDEVLIHGLKNAFVGDQYRRLVDESGAVIEPEPAGICQLAKL